jgi:molecular chaperone GrpE
MSQTNDQKSKGYTVNDQRWWLREEALEKVSSTTSRLVPHYVEELEQRLENKEKLLQQYITAHKESKADMDGARRRLEAELEKRVDVEKTKVASVLLELLDGLERLEKSITPSAAIENLVEGMKLLQRQVQRELDKMGLTRIEAAGRRFDPQEMEALLTEPVEAERDGLVIDELRSGYKLKGMLVRPAGVKVGVSGT